MLGGAGGCCPWWVGGRRVWQGEHGCGCRVVGASGLLELAALIWWGAHLVQVMVGGASADRPGPRT